MSKTSKESLKNSRKELLGISIEFTSYSLRRREEETPVIIERPLVRLHLFLCLRLLKHESKSNLPDTEITMFRESWEFWIKFCFSDGSFVESNECQRCNRSLSNGFLKRGREGEQSLSLSLSLSLSWVKVWVSNVTHRFLSRRQTEVCFNKRSTFRTSSNRLLCQGWKGLRRSLNSKS
jgi:hypothetical protein